MPLLNLLSIFRATALKALKWSNLLSAFSQVDFSAEVNVLAVKWNWLLILNSLLMMYIYQLTNHMDQFKLAWVASGQRCRSCWSFQLFIFKRMNGILFPNIGDMRCLFDK